MMKLLIGSLFIACTLYNVHGMELTKQKINLQQFLYSHGLTSNGSKAEAYKEAGVMLGHVNSLDYQDAGLKLGNISLHFWNAAVAQEDDMKMLATAFNKSLKPVVLFGESRGASTIINCLAGGLMRPELINGVVLDSPFDHAKNVMHFLITQFRLGEYVSPEAAEKLIPYIYHNYKLLGTHPIDAIDSITDDIPMLLIASKEDRMVPWTCSIALYKRLRASGHSKVHLALLSHGSHGWLITGKCADTYKSIVHAFYKHYGIQHNAVLAERGAVLFRVFCQPSDKELEDPVILL